MTSSVTYSSALQAVEKYISKHWLDIFDNVVNTAPAQSLACLKKAKPQQSQEFIQELNSWLTKLLSPLKEKYAQGDMVKAAFTTNSLSILGKQEQSLQVFSEAFEARAASLCDDELALLVLRFEFLTKQLLDVNDLPVSPSAVIKQVKTFVLGFEVDSEIQLFLFKAILREFTVNYQTLIEGLNNVLIDQGVLTTLDESDAYSRQLSQQKKEHAKENRNFMMADLLGDVQTDSQGKTIKPSMAKVLEKVDIAEDNAEHLLYSDADAEIITESQIIEHLDNVFKVQESLSDNDSSYKKRQKDTNLTQSLTDNTQLSSFSLSKKNSSTIGMMSMLFESLFEDDLPEPIQALIEQLQIPMLKTALLDKNFFADSNNPAQLLLNTLVEHAKSWEPIGDPSKDFLYRKIESIITKVNQNFDGKYDVFVDAMFEFDEFLESHLSRVKRIEERIISLEKAKSRQDKARSFSSEHIQDKLSGGDIDEDLKAFFFNEWQKVLFFTHNKYGNTHNDEWQSAIDAESKIISLLRGDSATDKREAVYALQAAMLSIGLQKADVNRELKRAIPLLKKYHWPAGTNNSDDASDDEGVSGVIREKDSTISDILDILTVAEEEVESIQKKILSEQSKEEVASVVEETDSSVSVEDLKSLLTVGTWLLDSREEPALKIKVAAFIRYSDTYILVTRTGVKYASFNSEEMLELLSSEKINIIESSMIFDRALEAVIESLKPKDYNLSSM